MPFGHGLAEEEDSGAGDDSAKGSGGGIHHTGERIQRGGFEGAGCFRQAVGYWARTVPALSSASYRMPRIFPRDVNNPPERLRLPERPSQQGLLRPKSRTSRVAPLPQAPASMCGEHLGKRLLRFPPPCGATAGQPHCNIHAWASCALACMMSIWRRVSSSSKTMGLRGSQSLPERRRASTISTGPERVDVVSSSGVMRTAAPFM